MILYPDQRVEQPFNETVCFAAPIHKHDWEFLLGRGQKNKLPSTGMCYAIIEDGGGCLDSVYFMRNFSEITDRACVLLRANEDRDVCLESAAWIRVKEEYHGMIYIVRAGSENIDKWQSYNAAIGAEQSSICMIDFETTTEEV